MIQQRRLVGTALVIVLFSFLGLAKSIFAASNYVAKINKRTISVEEFNRKYRENLKFFQHRTPSKKAVLDDLIKRELGIQEAKKLGLDQDPSIRDRMNTVLYHALLEKKLSQKVEKIHVSTGEARKFYQKNPEVRTSHIFVPVTASATAAEKKAARKTIDTIYKKYVKPGKMTFTEIAQKHSTGTAAPLGGDIGYQGKNKLDPVYYSTARKLRVGKVSRPIQTAYGYHIVKLTGVRKWADADRPAVKRALFDERRQKIFDRYMKHLRRKAKISIQKKYLR